MAEKKKRGFMSWLGLGRKKDQAQPDPEQESSTHSPDVADDTVASVTSTDTSVETASQNQQESLAPEGEINTGSLPEPAVREKPQREGFFARLKR
ncbi:hypothetical protein BZG76_14565, partial [Salinivibrio sp. AR647]